MPGCDLLCAPAVHEVADDLASLLVLIDLVPGITAKGQEFREDALYDALCGHSHHRIRLCADPEGLVLGVVTGAEAALVVTIGLPPRDEDGGHAVDPLHRHHGIGQNAVPGVQAIDLDVRRRFVLFEAEGDICGEPIQGVLLPPGPHGRDGEGSSISDLLLLLMPIRGLLHSVSHDLYRLPRVESLACRGDVPHRQHKNESASQPLAGHVSSGHESCTND